jgi:hypothetical protein
LGEALVATGSALHAFVLMTNHVHLLLTPSDVQAVPHLMISLGRRYVQYINRSYRRTGTLWDSRYKSSLVQADTYLLSCQRYIELNPVRAAMVADPAHLPLEQLSVPCIGRTQSSVVASTGVSGNGPHTEGAGAGLSCFVPQRAGSRSDREYPACAQPRSATG